MSAPKQPDMSFNWKSCALVGCLLAFLAAAGVGGATYYLYHRASQALVTDPNKVEELARSIFPGARPPAGYQARFALDLVVFQGVSIGPVEHGDLKPGQCELLLVRMPQTDDLNVRSIQEQMKNPDEQRKADSEVKELSRDTVSISMGGTEVPVYHSVVEEKGVKSEDLVAVFEDQQKRLVACIAMGPQDGFDRSPALEFFQGLRVDGLKAVDPTRYESGPAEAPDSSGPD